MLFVLYCVGEECRNIFNRENIICKSLKEIKSVIIRSLIWIKGKVFMYGKEKDKIMVGIEIDEFGEVG